MFVNRYDKDSKEKKYASYFDITAKQFKNNEIDEDLLNKIYLDLLIDIDKITTSPPTKKPRLIIFISELLTHYHAPSKSAFSFANFLKNIYTGVIFIVSPPSVKCNSHVFKRAYWHGDDFDYVLSSDIVGFKEGLKSKVFYLPFELGTGYAVNFLKRKIKVSKNDLVLCVGHSIPFFDLIESKKKIIFPTINKRMPTFAEYMVKFDCGFERLNSKNEEIAMLDQVYGYSIFGSDTFNPVVTESRFPIEEERDELLRVCVSGNRLEKDLAQAKNVILINKICSLPGVSVHLVGNTSFLDLKLFSAVKIHPFQRNLQSYYSNFDLVLNIYRNGNGTQARMALAQGIPLCSPPGNDFSAYTPKELIYESTNDAVSLIYKLSRDVDFYNKIKKLTLGQRESRRKVLAENLKSTESFFNQTLYATDFNIYNTQEV